MEIEIKIPMKKEDWEAMVENLKDVTMYVFKKDTYYSKCDTVAMRRTLQEPLIRIRDTSQSQYLTIKKKSVKDNVEVNEELESNIGQSIEAVLELLKLNGYSVWFEKNKKSHRWSQILNHINLTCELVCVNGAYYYFEVEAADYNASEKSAIEALKECVKKYGLKWKNRDSRSWVDIIQNHKENDDVWTYGQSVQPF